MNWGGLISRLYGTEVLRYYCRAGLFGSIGIVHADSSWAVCWLVSALSTPNGGEGYNSSTDLNPNTNTSIQHCIQAESPHQPIKTTSRSQPKYCMHLLINLHAVAIYEINIQKEWHWPPNSWVNMNYSVHTDFQCHIAKIVVLKFVGNFFLINVNYLSESVVNYK